MNFRTLELKKSYISCGESDIAGAFLVPALKLAKTYKRSVGFFSSTVIQAVIDGLSTFIRQNGRIQLIVSPQLTLMDVQAISLGYQMREQKIISSFTTSFEEELEKLDDFALRLMADLICEGTLDIKLAVSKSLGFYHDKLGIVEDADGNQIAFYGSANSSINGYQNNYEKVRLARSWVPGEDESVADEVEEFDAIWDGSNPYIETYHFTEAAKKCLLQIVEHRQSEGSQEEAVILRDYQQQAIAAWVANGYHGFYVMATGTGKTWTAIYSAKKLLETKSSMVVICAPYKHLVKQWSEDVEKVFPNAKIILISSENPSWNKQATDAIIAQRLKPETQVILISTIASFKMERFFKVLKKSKQNKLLIVDEAHRFTLRTEAIQNTFSYLLGLSATPHSGRSAQSGRELMEYFGGEVFHLGIEEALERGYLVPYYYHPIYVEATESEEKQFKYHTQKILSCFRGNVCINPDLLVRSLRNRLRVISMAENKQNYLPALLRQIPESDHFVVYCGDGRLYDTSSGEELRHIQSVKRHLSDLGYKSSQFTAQENMVERMKLVDLFNRGQISALAAIRCLDEGINIPSIKSALILSSNDDYREFVQRRGRILRLYPGKEFATIYDVIVLPSSENSAWAKIELRRFYEYAKLAINSDAQLSELENHLNHYSLSLEDVDVYDFEDMEDIADE